MLRTRMYKCPLRKTSVFYNILIVLTLRGGSNVSPGLIPMMYISYILHMCNLEKNENDALSMQVIRGTEQVDLVYENINLSHMIFLDIYCMV